MSCTIEGCGKGGRIVRGMCRMHYERVRRHGDPHIVLTPHRNVAAGRCEVGQCGRRGNYSGLCETHHWRVSRYGSTLGHIPVGAQPYVLAEAARRLEPVPVVCVDCGDVPWGGTLRCEPCLRADLASRVAGKPAESGRPSDRGGVRQVRLPRGVAA